MPIQRTQGRGTLLFFIYYAAILIMKAQDWNDKYAVGQPVCLTEDDGSMTYTQTRTEAWELGSGHSVVSVAGKTGGYSLDRIQAR